MRELELGVGGNDVELTSGRELDVVCSTWDGGNCEPDEEDDRGGELSVGPSEEIKLDAERTGGCELAMGGIEDGGRELEGSCDHMIEAGSGDARELEICELDGDSGTDREFDDGSGDGREVDESDGGRYVLDVELKVGSGDCGGGSELSVGRGLGLSAVGGGRFELE